MAERDEERVSRAYREMPGGGPPASLDAAIQAAARRAVGARPGGSRRWQVPVSIAAVLALAVGVSLHVEREKPLVVDGTPVSPGAADSPAPSSSAEYPVASPATEPEAPKPGGASAMRKEPEKKAAPTPAASIPEVARPDSPVPEAARAASPPAAVPQAPSVGASRAASVEERSSPGRAKESVAVPEAKRFAPDPPRREAAPAAAAPRVPPPAFAPSAEPLAQPRAAKSPAPLAQPPAAGQPAPDVAGAPGPAESAASSVAPVPRAKSEAARQSPALEKAMADSADTPERRLERIAELRDRGRHEEADRALAEFRRDFPGHRMSEEWRRKVERR